MAFTLGIVPVGSTETAPAPKEAVVAVKGLACSICARRLQKVLGALPGATKVQVDLHKGRAVIDFTAESEVADEQIRKAVRDAGFVPGTIGWHTGTASTRKSSS